MSAKARSEGWTFSPDEDHVQAQFKALLFLTAGTSGDPTVIKAAQDMFAAFAAGDRKAIHPNIRPGVFTIALQNGGEKEYEILLNLYCQSTDVDERFTALLSLSRGKGEKLIQRTLSLPLSDEVKGQDIYMPISGLRHEPAGIVARWEWLKTNWEALLVKCPPSLTLLSSVVSMCTGSFTKTDQLQDVQDFFREKDKKGFERALEQSLDGVRAKAGWVERDAEDVLAYLKEEGYLGDVMKEKS